MVGVRLGLGCLIASLWLGGGRAAEGQAQAASGAVADDDEKESRQPLVMRFDGGFRRAFGLFRQGRFAEAERQFASVAEARRGTTWGEQAQFYLGECRYQQKKYVLALQGYEKLSVEYPATNYRDDLVRREYEIARTWLAQIDPATPAGEAWPWTARLDGRAPLLDCGGWALRALEDVYQAVPEGPLADAAAIRIADYYMGRHDYAVAAAYYDQFLREFHRSPFRGHAQLGAIEARVRGFLGAVIESGSFPGRIAPGR